MESAVATKQHDADSLHPIEVRVAHTRHGGWDVIVTQDARILEIQHCDDWHRAERAYVRMIGCTAAS